MNLRLPYEKIKWLSDRGIFYSSKFRAVSPQIRIASLAIVTLATAVALSSNNLLGLSKKAATENANANNPATSPITIPITNPITAPVEITNYSLAGAVTFSNNQPVKWLAVSLYDYPSNELEAVTYTDYRGKFIFPKVKQGNYYLLPQKDRYIYHPKDINVSVMANIWDLNFTAVYQSPDINNDGFINGKDINLTLESWGKVRFDASSVTKRKDLDYNGKINVLDAIIIIANWSPLKQ
jgi:hypothetical protein